MISRLTAEDGFSFHGIVRSQFIRRSLNEKGYSPPLCPKTAARLVISFSKSIKENLSRQISGLLLKGTRFSISLDEYTSCHNRRFMNINLHTKECFWNLGMQRISGSMPAEKVVEMVSHKLLEYGLVLSKHIVATVNDGASVMVKYGKLIEPEQQLCYAHGIHLAVCDFLYSPTSSFIEKMPLDEEEFSDDAITDLDGGIDYSIPPPLLREWIEEVISKVRRIVRLFKRSPVKNSILQKYVREENGKELSLLLDCKTRWNSLLAMIDRFISLKKPISKALIDIAATEKMDSIDWEILDHICRCLKPIEIAVCALSRRDATLLSAEGVYRFLMDQFDKNSSISFCQDLKSAVEKRFLERRQNNIVNIYRFLLNPSGISGVQTNNSTLVSTIKRLFPSEFSDTESQFINVEGIFEESNAGQEAPCEIVHNFTSPGLMQPTNLMLVELESAIRESTTTTNDKIPTQTLDQIISDELDLFRKKGTKSKNLTLVSEALDTIPPTSMESERAFSAAGLFITKIRSRLADDTLDSLCFIRSYFKNQKN